MKRITVIGTFACGFLAGSAVAVPTVDFSETKPLRPELHSSGLGGQLVSISPEKLDDLRPLNLWAARTHDWALLNPGQRMLDTHFIFPLQHLDAKDPRNYFFGPTDEVLEQTVVGLGMRVMYRMGTSIESVNGRRNDKDPSQPRPKYYNSVEPLDWDKYADVLEHIIAHYTEGWNNGYKWADKITYWELWNEPNDRPGGSWIKADGDLDRERNWKRFQQFYVHVLKKLKARFPNLRFGGPATCYMDLKFLRNTLLACKVAGYTPDFLSWHGYSLEPYQMLEQPAEVRKLCDELGFKEMELVINEWHYLPYGSIWGDLGRGPDRYRRATDSVNGFASIEDGVYTLQVIEGLQDTCLGQNYYYGCGQRNGGSWGIRNGDGSLNKPYYALNFFGTIIGDCDRRTRRSEELSYRSPWQAYGYVSKDGKRKYVSVSRFKGGSSVFSVRVKGIDGMKCVSVRTLDRYNDFAEVIDQQKAAKGDYRDCHTPFAPAVTDPVFYREGDVFRFVCWEPNSSAWLLMFE